MGAGSALGCRQSCLWRCCVQVEGGWCTRQRGRTEEEDEECADLHERVVEGNIIFSRLRRRKWLLHDLDQPSHLALACSRQSDSTRG